MRVLATAADIEAETTLRRSRSFLLPGGVSFHGDSERAAATAAVEIINVFVGEFTASVRRDDDDWTASAFADVVEAFVGGVVEQVASPLSDDSFSGLREAVYNEVQALPSWARYRQQVVALANSFDTARALRCLRMEAGFSIEGLADRVKVDKTNVKDHLAGKTLPRDETLRAYVDVFSQALGRRIPLGDLK